MEALCGEGVLPLEVTLLRADGHWPTLSYTSLNMTTYNDSVGDKGQWSNLTNNE